MATKLDKIIAFIKSKYFFRVLLLIVVIGIMVAGFNITYDKKTGKFGCSKEGIDIQKHKGE